MKCNIVAPNICLLPMYIFKDEMSDLPFRFWHVVIIVCIPLGMLAFNSDMWHYLSWLFWHDKYLSDCTTEIDPRNACWSMPNVFLPFDWMEGLDYVFVLRGCVLFCSRTRTGMFILAMLTPDRSLQFSQLGDVVIRLYSPYFLLLSCFMVCSFAYGISWPSSYQ